MDATAGSLEFVVAAHDAEATIRACVESLLALDAAARVTVVNDASQDRTGPILAQIDDPRLRVINVGYRSRARAANVGFRASECDIVCSVDADVRYVQDRFDEILPLLATWPFLMLTQDPRDTTVRPVRLGAEFAEPRNSFIFSRTHLPGLRFAEVYPKTGGEDTDLMLRLLKVGVAVAAMYGGYEHARTSLQMGLRRRAHFHWWNIRTYLRHLDVPMCRQRLAAIARHPVRRTARSLREELGSGHGV